MTVTEYDLDLLRDRRHESARAYSELAEWLEALELKGLAARTRSDYLQTGARLLRMYPDLLFAEMTDAELMRFLRTIPSASRHTRGAALSSLFRWLHRTRRIAENPMDFIELPKRRAQPIVPVYTDVEVARFLHLPVRDGALYAILFGTGIRRSEAIHLRWRDINIDVNPDHELGELIVYQGKGAKDRIVPVEPSDIRLLAKLAVYDGLDDDDYLWYQRPGGAGIDRSRPISETSFARWHRRCSDDAEVRYLKPHSTRHTYATNWRNRGLDLDDVQELLGHASPETTKRIYVHTGIKDVAARMAALGAGR